MFQVSRRDLVLSAAGAYAAFGLNKSVAFIGAAHAQQDGAPFRRHKIGDLEVISLLDGAAGVPPREGFIRTQPSKRPKRRYVPRDYLTSEYRSCSQRRF